MKIENVLIVGGGIGGLTLALALGRANIPCTVFERAPELKEVGAGVGVWTNAFKVLDRLGVGTRIRAAGAPLRVAEMCSPDGRVLSRSHLDEVVPEAGAACYVLHRAELHAALAEQLPAGTIRTNHECVGVEGGEAGVTIHFAGGASAKGTLLVGADGINSTVRAHLWGRAKPRYAGQTCFRAVIKMKADDGVMREIHGAGKRFGISPMSDGRIYWYAALNAPEGKMIDFVDRQRWLLAEFKDWRWNIHQIISATPSGAILQNDLVDRVPITRWGTGAITLLGDAAHPTTPNFGQGACMAIEDAMILTRHLLRGGRVPDALRGYEQERSGRTATIVKQSWTLGALAKWEHPLAVRLRELIVRATPQSLMRQTMRKQAGFDAGNFS